MMDAVEQIACFRTILDPYNGITIESNCLPSTKDEFETGLDILIEVCKNKRNLIWIYINIENSDFIPIATKKGFDFYSCERSYVLLVKKMNKDVILPTAPNHTLGVGVVVINDYNEVLVVKERISNVGYKLPGGHIDDKEMISKAAIREVFEETGIDVQFDKIISLGHFYPHQFHKSNLYVLCLAKPLNQDIDVKDTHEIEDAKWVDINIYLEDEKVDDYSKIIVKTALEDKGLIKTNKEILIHLKKDFELFFPTTSLKNV